MGVPRVRLTERASLLETVAKLQDELNRREEVHKAEVADL